MAERIKRASVLTDDEREWLFHWGDNIFGDPPAELKWRSKDVHFVLYKDGEPVSHVSILKHEIKVGRKPLLVAGLGGVVTRPEAQGKGFASKLMRRAAKYFKQEWQVDAGLLFCLPHMVPYYEWLGWHVIEEPVFFRQPSGKIESPFIVMVLPCNGHDWPAGKVELKSLPW
jgi:GNAT superfamily N-acetyltransferase